MRRSCAAIRQIFLAFVLLVIGFAAPMQVDAVQERKGGFRPEAVRVQKKSISREEAAAIVKRRYGGKILAISEVQRNGRNLYRVKGLSKKSQVYVVYVDKHSGRISRS